MDVKRASQRLIELDILRALAVIGVILIHVVSGALYYVNQSTLSFKVYVTIDQFLRFCVPLFVALSGYTLALKYTGEKINLGEFFNRRIVRLLPWYLFWSAVIFLYLRFTHWWDLTPRFPFWKILFLGKADYHLYFVPMILQLYILFPFLPALYNKFKVRFLIIVFLLQILFYWFLTQISLDKINIHLFTSDQQQYLFFGTWFFYFLLGIVLKTQFKVSRLFEKIIPLLLVLFCLWVLIDCFGVINKSYNIILATRSARIPVLFYASTFIVFSILYSKKLLLLPGKIVVFLSGVGRSSYVIYLLHTLVIRVFSDYIHFSGNLHLILIAILSIFGSNYLARISVASVSFLNSKIFDLTSTRYKTG